MAQPWSRLQTMAAESTRPVLVVDDDLDVRETIAEYLEARGFEVLQAANGVEALFHLKRARPAAVVLDLMMPRVGGLEALKHIKKFDPTITVVVVTGQASADLAAQARAQGAVAVLPKPVPFDELTRALGAIRVKAPSAASPAPAPGRPAAGPDVSAPVTPAAARILVVDDEPAMLATLEEFLQGKGYRTATASDGEGALRAIREEPPDVILLDFHMPRLGGLEALTAIRSAAPDTKVIMVSGLDDAGRARQTMAYGAADFIVKPVDLNYLAQSVETALLWKRLGGG